MRWLLAIWAAIFLACLIYWTWAEELQPGQQYADPLLPCAWVASWLTSGAAIGLGLGGLIVDLCRGPRKTRND